MDGSGSDGKRRLREADKTRGREEEGRKRGGRGEKEKKKKKALQGEPIVVGSGASRMLGVKSLAMRQAKTVITIFGFTSTMSSGRA